MQKKSKKISALAQHKNLSIQFSLDGFSFCISNSETKDPIVFTQYIFDTPLASPEALLNEVINIFGTDKDLQQDFTSIFAIHQNNLSTLVPDKYFDKNNLDSYLKYTVKTLSTDLITYDSLDKMDAHTVYIPYVNINNYLFQNFGEFEFKHHSTVLINKLLKQVENNLKDSFYVHVSVNQLDIVVFEKNSLKLYNSFSFQTKEDFIYYILFTAEQLEMDPNVFELSFIGDIEKESELYNITYNYVRNINFISSKSGFFTSSTDFLTHTNFILVS